MKPEDVNSFSTKPRTKEEIGATIELIALQDVMEEAVDKTRQDICQDCLDRRCEAGRICKEFMRRSEAYAWEIIAEKAELN